MTGNKMRGSFSVGGLAAAAAAGLVVALTLAGTAAAYTVDQLPGLGYSVSVTHLGNGCSTWLAGYGNAAKTDLGNDCDAGFQARVDALVAATCPCAAPPTTTAAATSPSVPAATTTQPATTTAAAPPAATTTVVTTVTDPATAAAVTDLETRIAALESQVANLQARVDALVSGQSVTLSSRAWIVVSAKDGLATLVAKVKRPGEKTKPHRKVPSAVLVPLLKK